MSLRLFTKNPKFFNSSCYNAFDVISLNLNLGEGEISLPPVGFPFIKAAILTVCSIQEHFIKDILAKFGICDFSQSLDIGEISDAGLSVFRIFRQYLTKENCHNSRANDDIDKKLGPVPKFDEKIKTTPKIFVDDATLAYCDVIVFLDLWAI